MKRALRYKGHFASVDFDPIEMKLIGRLAGIPDIVTFDADAPAAIKAAFRNAVDGYLKKCADSGRKPERPYSGKFMARIDPALHAEAARAAELSGLSFNAWVEAVIRRAAAELHDDAAAT